MSARAPADDLFAPGFSTDPWWWEASPPSDGDTTAPPAEVDVAVIGSGYTGLHAAIETARAGLSTVVFEAGAAGAGCSTRNGGQISTSIKPDRATLARRHGDALAEEILAAGRASRAHVEAFVRDEGIDCDFRVTGRFHGAHTGRVHDALAARLDTDADMQATGAFLVPRGEQRRELGTDAYHGGIVFPRHASIDPGRYHAGTLRVARAAGARIVCHCAVRRIERYAEHSVLHTARGATRARRVVLATNGYTGELVPQLRRRVIPIGSYVIATEELSPALMDELMPTGRILSDSRRLVYYYRPSPDRRRILFGGRVSLAESDPRRSAPKLHAELVRLFPELRGTRVSHSWSGTVAYTFDTLMHAGERAGVHYAMGYCGSGVGMAGYLGMHVGRAVAGTAREETPLSRVPFATRPYYRRRPWFLAPSVLAYRVLDRIGR